MPTRQEALKNIVVTLEKGIASMCREGKSRTYKGHGDDYAVVEKGLMARGGGSRVVMQQAVRARRRRTLVLHTPPSLPLPTFLPPAPATEGDASPGKCHLLQQQQPATTWVAVCGHSLLSLPFPFLHPGSAVLHQLACDGRRSGGAFEERSIKY